MSELSRTHWSEVLAARGGDAGALDALVAKYRPAVVRYLSRRGFSAEAEDLAQEVFVRLIFEGALARVSPSKGRFRSLVLALTRHAAGHHLDYLNAAKRGGGRVQSLPEIDLSAPEQEEAFDREWVKNLLDVALARLAEERPRHHQALRLFAFEGRSQSEVASELGVSRQDVKNHVHRARARLARLLREEMRGYCATPEEYEEELRLLRPYLPPEPR